MGFLDLLFAYKEGATAAKLAQMMENIRAHDHRSDGTQGGPFVGDWVAMAGAAASTGFSLDSARYRLVTPVLAVYDVHVTRTGADLSFVAPGAGISGNVADTPCVTGISAAARPATLQNLRGLGGSVVGFDVTVSAAGVLTVTNGAPGGAVTTGLSCAIQGLIWLG